ELQKRLAAEQARHNLYITEMPGNALRIGIASDYSFAVDSAELTLGAKATFAKIANVLKDYDSTAVHVVGFTDSSGAAEYNMKLSQRRAEAVASFLGSEGVPYARMRTWGRGETQPIASNQTKAGRSRNRRVEIVIKPIIKGQAGDAFTAPQNLGA
ncbi:MAG: OmpA family protein, partial [Salinisphaera sp.]|nr:OmpA family protein [Salinisphaera sp.]